MKMMTVMLLKALDLTQDESCLIMEWLPNTKMYLAVTEPVGTFCDVNSSCDGQGHCVNALCEACAADINCVSYAACLQGFYPDQNCEELDFAQETLDLCM